MKAFTNALLVVRCYLYALVRGAAKHSVTAPRTVCIIQVAKLGDMICTTPMFRAVKAAYPTAKVVVVGNMLNEQVLRGNPDVDEYIRWERDARGLAARLRALGCDYGCTTSPNIEGLAALFLAGVRDIAVPKVEGGASVLETRAYRLLRLLVRAVPHTFNAYAPREYLRLLEPVGIVTDNTKKYIYVDAAATRSAQAAIAGANLGEHFAVIAPGSGHPLKRWPPERFAAVAEHIATRYMPVAVIGSSADAEEIAAMMSHVTHGRVVDLSNRFSIEELKAFIGRSALFVSGDTGPLYIAEALGVPTLDIVGPASDTSQPPRGPRNIVITPSRTAPAMTVFSTQRIDLVETKRQAEATQVPEVLGAIDSLLARA